jgi:hypothetical protein
LNVALLAEAPPLPSLATVLRLTPSFVFGFLYRRAQPLPAAPEAVDAAAAGADGVACRAWDEKVAAEPRVRPRATDTAKAVLDVRGMRKFLHAGLGGTSGVDRVF